VQEPSSLADASTRPVVAAFDLRTSGVWTCVLGPEGPRVVNLSAEGILPDGPVSLKVEMNPGERPVPHFFTLGERLGEEGVITLEDGRRERPEALLRGIALAATRAARPSLSRLDSAGVVVPGHIDKLQRELVAEAFRAAGWSQVTVVRRTAALAAEGLEGRKPGQYLVLTLGHGATEGTIIDWTDRRATVLAHASERRISGDELDRRIMLRLRAETSDPVVGLAGGADWSEWYQLRRQAEAVRRRLNHCDSVTVELPSGPAGQPEARRVRFDRAAWEASLAPTLALLRSLVTQLLEEARLRPEQVTGAVVGGGLAMQAIVVDELRGICRPFGFQLAHDSAACIGAARLALAATSERAQPSPSTDEAVRLPLTSMVSADLARAPASPLTTPAPAGADEDARNQRRDYVRAREVIKDAELALKLGQLTRAVQLSHRAYQESADGRIFAALIEVHLRAVRKKPATVENFHEQRIWLVCARQDDPTNATVQEAIRVRYLAHLEQMVAIGTAAAREEARKALAEVSRLVDLGEAVLPLIQTLESRTNEAGNLPP
jgi:hypothetical protein